MALLEGDDDFSKLKCLSSKTYKEQAVYFLNACWDPIGEKEAENIWQFVNGMVEIDEQKGKDGNELDEMMSHRFLEQRGETLTVRELRVRLRDIDIDTNRYLSLVEYLIFRYKNDWHELVNSSQTASSDELIEAERLLNEAQSKMKSAVEIANTARTAEKDMRAAMAELESQQKEYDDRAEDLKAKTEKGGLVSQNRAKNELQQHIAADPLPLSRAKINQGASVRKSEKARKAVEPAEKEAIESFNAADEFMKEVAARSGGAKGGIWWLQRELEESKKYLPQSKGGKASR